MAELALHRRARLGYARASPNPASIAQSQGVASAVLRIAVCIKQIPLVEDANFDPVTKTIRRDGT
ncbi:MAG: hypothetical protein WCA59_17235, partial [Candidatus Binataceae bacterium]